MSDDDTTPPDRAAFAEFGLDPALTQGIADLGFHTPTPIQRAAIGALLQEHDVIGSARTGSGKTAAFGLPLLHRVRSGGAVRALVLAPTRELALQVSDALSSFATHLDAVDVLTIYGGASYKPQLQGLRRGATVVVGTPGRVLDLADRGALDFGKVEYLVLDEADEMLRMGFIDDVERVLAGLPQKRQIALFSATMPPQIRRLAQTYLSDPIEIQVEQDALSVGHIEQSFVRVGHREKNTALLRLLAARPPGATLVFARTRKGCAEVAEYLIEQGISADALHGDLNQGARERVLSRLRSRALDVVVATDVAARGIDVDHLSCVINYDIPDDAESYTHRIGRTARAGRSGMAITLITSRDFGKAKHIRRELGAEIADDSLPSNAEIASARRNDVVDQIEAALEATNLADVRAWLDDVLEQRGWDPADVAAAATHLLRAEHTFDFDPEPPADERNFAAINETEVILDVGRKDGIRPADIVGALANDVGIPASQIGKISLGSGRAFVGLPENVARALIAQHPVIELRGRNVNVRLHPSQTSAAAPTPKPVSAAAAAPAAASATEEDRSKGRKPKKPITTKSPRRSKRDKNKGAPGRHKKRGPAKKDK